MNDNERKGLPRDIDMLTTAINAVQRRPGVDRRLRHLARVMNRVLPQVQESITSERIYGHGGVIGKFNNYHKGHFELIKYALTLCDTVTVLLCSEPDDPIDVDKRARWMRDDFGNRIDVIIVRPSDYNLSNKSESDREVSEQWATWIDEKFPEIEAFIGSEDYINYCAEYGHFDGVIYDIERKKTPISSTDLRESDGHELYAPSAREARTFRVGFIGPESSGKSYAAANVSAMYESHLITEAARNIMNDSHYTFGDLEQFAIAQHGKIIRANTYPLSVVDSTAVTTAMYSQMQFNRVSPIVTAIALHEPIDMYFVFDTSCEYVQDGTREMSMSQRNAYFDATIEYLENNNKPHTIITGKTWEERQKQVEVAMHIYYKEA